MFELVNIPELQELQQKAAKLEKLKSRKDHEWQMLNQQAERVQQEDIRREAEALHRGEDPPEPQEPEVREKLEAAWRERQVLEARHLLAQGDVGRFVVENVEMIAAQIRAAYKHKANEVAEVAQNLSLELSRLWGLEQDFRKLQPYWPQPEPEPQPAQKYTTSIIGVNTRNVYQDHINGVARHTLTQALTGLVDMRTDDAAEEASKANSDSPPEDEEAVAAGNGQPVEVDASEEAVEVK